MRHMDMKPNSLTDELTVKPTRQAQTVSYQEKAPIIQAEGVSKVRHAGNDLLTVISDVSLTVHYGDFAIIFGPSGAGKSTLLHMLFGIQAPDVGEVLIKNESLYEYSPEERGRIRLLRFGYVPQQQHWIGHLSVQENVAYPLIIQGKSHREANQAAKKFLELVKMDHKAAVRPNQLSIGQQQKVAMARALINDPWIIFADEPTEHLDTQSADEIMQLLLATNREEGRTVFMVTHNLQFLKDTRKWFFMQEGRLWDIRHHKSPFASIKEAVSYIDGIEEEGGKA